MHARHDDGGDPLAALAEGDPAPFEAFVTTETPHLLAFFHHLGARRMEAEDLVQDTFLKLFQSSDHYRPDGRFRGYAYRIARNAWIDRARRQAHSPLREERESNGGPRQPSALEATIDRSVPDPPTALERREGRSQLMAALAALPEAQRLAFELGVVRELPYVEVATALEVPVGTVKSRVFHAVRRLRELLGDAAPAHAPAAPPSSARASAPGAIRKELR
ncbi:MAG: sigma-70 family RNA polymerase sigma factor [Planctomycetota bacterium]